MNTLLTQLLFTKAELFSFSGEVITPFQLSSFDDQMVLDDTQPLSRGRTMDYGAMGNKNS